MSDGVNIPGLNMNIGGSRNGGFLSNLVSPIEGLFSSVGLNSPLMRILGMAALSGAVLYFLQVPPFFENGVAKPWSIWAGEGEDSIAIPWWLMAIIVGIVFGVFL